MKASEAIKIMEKSKVLLGITPRDEPDDAQSAESDKEEKEKSGSSEDQKNGTPKRIGVRSGPLSIMELR